MEDLDQVRQVTCERCGTSFVCEAATGSCWCMEVDVSPQARMAIAQTYEDCLCRDCLTTLAAG